VLVEIHAYQRVAIYHDVAQTVDAVRFLTFLLDVLS
jgi:hypothetical protein